MDSDNDSLMKFNEDEYFLELGSFEKDIPEKIIGHQILNSEYMNKEMMRDIRKVYYIVKWMPRNNGITANNTIFPI